jgi:NADH:ubiquinone oxidoreductase subunit 5 (subunit L)/multisubunit Na+/H+ antiporter MnhA subunit
MEGPTPVSALIHAATMVTAGIFLIIRCSYLFEFSIYILNFISVIGALTALFGATTGLFFHDLKRVVAFSTCSQLGYMVMACGLERFNIAFFHLVTHAFFKALLFLTAGAIIHSMFDEQDIRKFGGLF